jgi:hypothetical protein
MKRLLIAAVAACALDSTAMANDLTFTWGYVGLESDTPRSLCGSDWRGCPPLTHDVSGTFTLTMPDDTFVEGDQVARDDSSIDTISFHTSGGELLFYKVTNNLSLHYLLVNTRGGTEETDVMEPDGYITSRTQITIGEGVTLPQPGPVPEPGSALLTFTGLAMLAIRARRRTGDSLAD